MVKMSLVLGYMLIFPDEKPRELNSYISGIDKKTLLKLCCHFSMTSKSTRTNKQLLSNWFQDGNQGFLTSVWSKVYELEKNNDILIVNPISSLMFFELVFNDWKETEITKNQIESEKEIFKLYLLLNEKYTGIKDHNVSVSTKNIDSKCQYEGMIFANSFVDSDFYNYEIKKVIITQFQKAYLLFQELDQDERYSELLSHFCNYYEVPDWKQYLKKVLPLIFNLIKANKEGNVTINITYGEHFDENCKFLEKFALTEDECFDSEYDFLKIRSNPLLIMERGKYLVINPLFLCERLFKGLYFTLNKLNNELTKPISNFKSIYNDKFSEQKLLYTILNDTFKDRYKKFTGEELRKLGMSGEPDYYIRNRNKVLLFESKDILIPAKVKISGDFNKLRQSFLKKLYFDTDHEKHKIVAKAIIQLVRNIAKLLKNDEFSEIDSELFDKSLNIYPILVLHDGLFNALGLNRLLNHWFQRELNKLVKERLDIRKVRPLIIIDVDTMINLQEAIRKTNCSYDKFIDDYLQAKVNFNPKKVRSEHHVETLIQNSMISFSFYLEELDLIKKNWSLPPQIEEYGRNLFT